MMDELAVASHQRAAVAGPGRPVQGSNRPAADPRAQGCTLFDTDEHVRPDTDLETLAAMKPVFKRDGGSVTAGNSSGINDGAAALVLAGAAW